MKKINIILNEPYLLILLPLSLLLLLVIILIRPLILIRIGFINCSRLGHFAQDTELFFLEQKIKNIQQTRIINLFYYPRSQVANSHLKLMWERNIKVYPKIILRGLCLIIRSFSFLNIHRCGNTVQRDRDILNLLDKFEPTLKFTSEEKKRGESELENILKIPKGRKFVCLIARDSIYLEKLYNEAQDYHNFRDVSLKNLYKAINTITSRGYFVVRMGVKVKSRLKTNNSMIIDYADSPMRSDFLDIYLGAKCSFCISNGTGFDAIPTIFRKPVLFINRVPASLIFTFTSNSIGLIKHHFSKKIKKILTLEELSSYKSFDSSFSNVFANEEIELIENSEDEINDAAIEMIDFIEEKNQDIIHHQLQKKYKKRYLEIITKKKLNHLHGEIKSNISLKFLMNNKSFLD